MTRCNYQKVSKVRSKSHSQSCRNPDCQDLSENTPYFERQIGLRRLKSKKSYRLTAKNEKIDANLYVTSEQF
jgi:hypothetical protein